MWWYPACLAVSPNLLRVWVAGESDGSSSAAPPPLVLSGTLVLGQEQDGLDSDFGEHSSFFGQVTGLVLWQSDLANSLLEEWANCQPPRVEPLLSWDAIEWVIHNESGRLVVQDGGPCENGNDKLMLFTNKMSWSQARLFLEYLGIAMAPVHNLKQRKQVEALVSLANGSCTHPNKGGSFTWLGVFYNRTSKQFENLSGQAIGVVPLWPPRYVRLLENMESCPDPCAVYQSTDATWLIGNNNLELCSVGKYEHPPPIFYLYDPNESSGMFHSMFILTALDSGGNSTAVYFHGFKQDIIVQSADSNRWCLREVKSPREANRTGAPCVSSDGPPVGRLKWDVGESSKVLVLSRCSSEEYTCRDGKCISLYSRCDFIYDCAEGDDERGCFTAQLTTGYVSLLAPQIPLRAEITVSVMRIGNVDLMNFAIDTDLSVTVEWRDSRVNFRHLHPSISTRKVIVEDKKVIVVFPSVIFCGHSSLCYPHAVII